MHAHPSSVGSTFTEPPLDRAVTFRVDAGSVGTSTVRLPPLEDASTS